MTGHIGLHAGDFAEPWRENEFRGKRGMWLLLSNEVVLFAVPPGQPDSHGWESWDCCILTGPRRRVEQKFSMQIGPEQNAACAILSKISGALDTVLTDWSIAAEDAWRMISNAKAMPEFPVPIRPRPNRWYDPRKHVPMDAVPVIAAWTSHTGEKHHGDRAAVFQDGDWRWAYCGDQALRNGEYIDAWMACPERPPAWK